MIPKRPLPDDRFPGIVGIGDGVRRNEAWKLLALAPGLTPHLRRQLLERSGGPVQAVNALVAGRCELYRLPWSLREWRQRATRVDSLVGRVGGRMIDVDDPAYPPALHALIDRPPILYCRGELPNAAGVAIVGSRECTGYGRDAAHRIARDLARADLPIVSGLARGVDAAAHLGALAADGVTVAVLPCGIERVYPARHRALARRISERGALITEFPPGTQPQRWTFPQRNRIIAAMSWATVVVEAAENSGTMSTVRAAADAGREVLAVPGPIDSPTSIGTNALIRDGAYLCEGWRCVLPHLPEEVRAAAEQRAEAGRAAPPTVELTEPQRACLEAMPRSGPSSIEALAASTPLEIPELLAVLTQLEVLGQVRRIGACGYERIRLIDRPRDRPRRGRSRLARPVSL